MNKNDPLNIEKNNLPIITQDHMVFFGCSYTKGTGLTDDNQRYANIMAQSLGKSVLNFAERGLNNYSTFDLFSQCDFIDIDIPVVVQLTELSRIQIFKPSLTNIQLSVQSTPCLLEVYHDVFLMYEMLKQLRMLVNFARLKKLRLIIWSIARFSNNKLHEYIEHYLSKYPEYIFMDNRLGTENSYRVDNGIDGSSTLGTGHPGPKSNEIIASQLLTHYRKLYQ
jgi:hypothetical protein